MELEVLLKATRKRVEHLCYRLWPTFGQKVYANIMLYTPMRSGAAMFEYLNRAAETLEQFELVTEPFIVLRRR
jgi:hypothetical protein